MASLLPRAPCFASALSRPPITTRPSTPFSHLNSIHKQSIPTQQFVQTQQRHTHTQTFDLAVIGGGSGGLAAAQRARSHGARVVVFDHVNPSPRGTRWGLGGTCVNVGCIPKKLMHHAARFRQTASDSVALGWAPATSSTADHNRWEHHLSHPAHDWAALVRAVQNHIKSLNFQYRTQLTLPSDSDGTPNETAATTPNGSKQGSIHLVTRGPAFLLDPENPSSIHQDATEQTLHRIHCPAEGPESIYLARRVVLATGTRPNIPNEIEGAVQQACVTSDDLFSLRRAPGRTLCVGASYIALECAGLLHGLGFPVTVAVRSVVLRGFDRQCADFVAERMHEEGVEFLHSTVPVAVERVDPSNSQSPLRVSLRDVKSGKIEVKEFDTVLLATGRSPDLRVLQNAPTLAARLPRHAATTRLLVGPSSRTPVPGLFALGDLAHGFPELTPVAIRQGEQLADSLFGSGSGSGSGSTPLASAAPIDPRFIPTVVFTPTEYGCAGLSEEDAIATYGADNVEVYLSQFAGLEQQVVHRKKPLNRRNGEWDLDETPPQLAKLVCNKADNDRVVGFHYVGPNAGEVTQGFALALQLGATKADFDRLVAIHPIDAEVFTQLTVTKRSGLPYLAKGGCGGGKCG